MKKIFSLIYLISLILLVFLLAWPFPAKAIDIQILIDPPSGAKVGDQVKITYRVSNDDPKAELVLLRIYDPDNLNNENMYSTKARQDAPGDKASMGWTYIWDTKASQSKPGNHRIDVVVTERDETQVLKALSAPLYNLAAITSPSPSASIPISLSPSSSVPPAGGASEALFPPNPETWTLKTIEKIINRILTYVSVGAGSLAVFLIVWFGFSYFTAFGSEEKIEGAKKGILYTLSGLAVIILAKVFIAVLLSVFQ